MILVVFDPLPWDPYVINEWPLTSNTWVEFPVFTHPKTISKPPQPLSFNICYWFFLIWTFLTVSLLVFLKYLISATVILIVCLFNTVQDSEPQRNWNLHWFKDMHFCSYFYLCFGSYTLINTHGLCSSGLLRFD